MVSGNISGTWSPSGNPYIVTDNATVPSGQTLTIQPGVTVWIAENLSISANGLIQAMGTSAQRITFQAPVASQFWSNVYCLNVSGTNRFSYCDFRNADTALRMSVYGGNATMNIEILNCTFSNCITRAIFGESRGWSGILNGDYAGRSATLSPVIKNCVFSNSGKGCEISIFGEIFGGAYAGYGHAKPTIIGNIFTGLTGPAFLMSVGSYAGSGTPLFINNTIINCGVGIDSRDPWDATAQNNIIVGTTNAVKTSGALSRKISYNCFYGNKTNFTGYPPAYGQMILQNRNGTACDLSYNIIQDPKFVSKSVYSLQTGSPCINAGDAAAVYDDTTFPPSMGTEINDMGAYGGPNAIPLSDADADGLPDSWEIKYFGSIAAYGPNDDPDGDHLINADEYAYNTDPTKKDTDGDGYSDKAEIAWGSDPLDPKSVPPPELSLTVEQVKLQFLPVQGQTNLIQASADLANWITVEEVAGTGDIVARTYGVTNGFRFFRLVRP